MWTSLGNILQSKEINKQQEPKYSRETTSQLTLRYGVYTLFACLYTLLAFSGFFSANSSIDQIFFGSLLGMWLGFALTSFLREPLYRHTTKLLNGEY